MQDYNTPNIYSTNCINCGSPLPVLLACDYCKTKHFIRKKTLHIRENKSPKVPTNKSFIVFYIYLLIGIILFPFVIVFFIDKVQREIRS